MSILLAVELENEQQGGGVYFKNFRESNRALNQGCVWPKYATIQNLSFLALRSQYHKALKVFAKRYITLKNQSLQNGFKLIPQVLNQPTRSQNIKFGQNLPLCSAYCLVKTLSALWYQLLSARKLKFGIVAYFVHTHPWLSARFDSLKFLK